tara:strand:- start:202 stop:1248 length:1047 start_codon:yes stop_codon:yes gene_type:complete
LTRSLLITGGAGFIAANFALYWTAKYPQDKVIILDSLTYASNLNTISGLIKDGKVIFVKGDINDKNLVLELFEKNKVNLIAHFAAESHVDRSINMPKVFLESNIFGTFNLLEAFRTYWVKNGCQIGWRFLHVSTDEVFGNLNSDSQPFDESTPYDPKSPYSASKAASDHLVRAWQNTFGIPALITNCSNNYGPFQFPEKLIPVTITNILQGKKIPIYGDGTNIRDWLYVVDHCTALEKILLFSEPGETFCIGGKNEVENIKLVNIICDLVDQLAPKFNCRLKNKKSSELIEFVDDRSGHDKRYAINATKIQNKLNWQPSISLNKGLYLTVEWYLKNKQWWEPLIKNDN